MKRAVYDEPFKLSAVKVLQSTDKSVFEVPEISH